MRFSKDGFPDLLPHAMTLPIGKKTVTVKLSGKTKGPTGDEALANAAAGFKRTPTGYTWHHHQDGKRMMLVPTDLHKEVKHTGGRARYREGTGDLTAYSD